MKQSQKVKIPYSPGKSSSDGKSILAQVSIINTACIVFILSIYSQQNTKDQNTYFYEHQMAASNKMQMMR